MKTLSLGGIARAMLVAAALCGAHHAQAQTIRVRVVDWITQQPIADAKVMVSRGVSLGMGRLPLGAAAAATDAKGEASFMNLPGEESFIAQKDGYAASCNGCPLLEKNEGGVRVRYLIPVREVALIELREELRLASDGPVAPAPARLAEIVQRFQRAKAVFDREVKRRQALQMVGSGACRRDERSGMTICPTDAADQQTPLHMEREEAALRRFCGLLGEVKDAAPADGAQREQLQVLQAYCAVVR